VFNNQGEASALKNPTNKKSIQTFTEPELHHLKPSMSKNIVVYFNPHADDEVLTFGIPILNDIKKRKKVYIVLISPGEDSIARDVVNGHYDHESFHPNMAGKPQWCNLHKRFHSPSLEGYQPLTQLQFGRERVNEFIRASTLLGVPQSRLFYYKLQNGHFGYHHVRVIMKEWAAMFPNATFKTMSKRDVHIDHAVLGEVMNEFHQKGILRHTVHYGSIATVMAHKVKTVKKVLLQNKQDSKKLNSAIDVYRVWNPKKHEFALGFHSVATQFEYIQKHMKAYQTIY
jgi:LmbE family N-acetylglucosaminyl deacetylase